MPLSRLNNITTKTTKTKKFFDFKILKINVKFFVFIFKILISFFLKVETKKK